MTRSVRFLLRHYADGAGLQAGRLDAYCHPWSLANVDRGKAVDTGPPARAAYAALDSTGPTTKNSNRSGSNTLGGRAGG